MIVAKNYEARAGRQILAVGARDWTEKQMRQSAHVARGVVQVAVTKHFWTGLGSFIWRKFMEKVWRHPRVQHVTKKAADVVRGKKEIKSTGPVSFYLKDVSEYKDQVKPK